MKDESELRQARMYFLHKGGRIMGIASLRPDEMKITAELNECEYIEADGDYETAWVDDGKLARRPIADFVLEGNTIHGVPEGAKVIIDGVEYVSDGTDIVLEFSHPGTYNIQVDAWPIMPWSCEVTV